MCGKVPKLTLSFGTFHEHGSLNLTFLQICAINLVVTNSIYNYYSYLTITDITNPHYNTFCTPVVFVSKFKKVKASSHIIYEMFAILSGYLLNFYLKVMIPLCCKINLLNRNVNIFVQDIFMSLLVE